ncbi:MAG TPA: aspartyl protease family protein [Steroidobacteraceae bacterium]|nr:aspartyl protease family protein [Steroidobacteraceae bacterium]
MLSVLFALTTAAACAADPEGRLLLEANHRAMDGPTSGAQVVSYDYRAQGLTGTARLLYDAGHGSFLWDRRLGNTTGANGFDGETPWVRDLARHHYSQRGGDKVALAINEAYRHANAWWRADAGGARVEPLGCDALRITPPRGKPFEAWFDPQSHLVTRVREAQSWNTVLETRYSQYRKSEGRMAPHRLELITNGDEAGAEVLELTSIARGDSATTYSAPGNRRDAAALPASGKSSVPFQLVNNHVIVTARINGRGPYPFLVDTGGHNILTPITARSLGIGSEGHSTGGGSGEATTVNGYALVSSIEVGGARMRDAMALTLDFSPADVEGLVLGGMLGSEFLERFVVEFDYGRKVLTFTDPAHFAAADRRRAGTALAMEFYDHMPQVTGTFEGRPARFNLDTGSRSDVSITAPFADRMGLRDLYPLGITVTDGWGSGGPARSFVVRAGRMTLGAVEVDRPIAGLSVAKRGVMADENFDGNVGSGLLKRFVVTFDFGGNHVYLRRLPHPDEDTGKFDRTGMWINLAWGGMRVMDVAAGSPAATAGIRAGDILTEIDGSPLAARTLSDARRHLKLLAPGKPVTIAYRRGDAAAEASLVPANLIPE